MDVEVSFPEELLIALKQDPDTFRREALLFTLGKLYEQGRISAGLAAQVMEIDRWTFYRLLTENGFAVIDYSEPELEEKPLRCTP